MRLSSGPGGSQDRLYKESASTAAAPVTGSLVFSALLDCLDEVCDNEHSGDAIGSYVYSLKCSESTVDSCWLGLPFGGFRCLYICLWSCCGLFSLPLRV